MADALAFIKILQENNPNAVVVLYGDHKPYFPDMSSEYTDSWDIPVLIFDSEPLRAQRVADASNGRPLYCLVHNLTREYFGFSLPSAHYAFSSCNRKLDHPDKIGPEWLYYMSLFDKPNS